MGELARSAVWRWVGTAIDFVVTAGFFVVSLEPGESRRTLYFAVGVIFAIRTAWTLVANIRQELRRQ